MTEDAVSNSPTPTSVVRSQAVLSTSVVRSQAVLPLSVVRSHAVLSTSVVRSHAVLSTSVVRSLCVLAALLPISCTEAPSPRGLHAQMVDLQFRHANVWFAGEAGNWPLAEYHMHELEELTGDIAELHPEYDGIPIAELMRAMLAPAVEQLVAAVDAGDTGSFGAAFDRVTEQCNACHQESRRGMIVVQRPRVPPFDNIRFAPSSAGPAAGN
jgi:hypothetical protein